VSPTTIGAAKWPRDTPVENVVRPQYEARFREQNQNLIGQVKPVH